MTRALPRGLLLAALCSPWLLPAPVAAQDEGAFDRTPQDCIAVSSIDETDALDDQTIIFHMRGKKAYRNHLPRRCPGLERENRIAYETRGSRLVYLVQVLSKEGHKVDVEVDARTGDVLKSRKR